MVCVRLCVTHSVLRFNTMVESATVRNPITKKKNPNKGGPAGVGRAKPAAVRNPITKKKFPTGGASRRGGGQQGGGKGGGHERGRTGRGGARRVHYAPGSH
jgi:hypothetical protein